MGMQEDGQFDPDTENEQGEKIDRRFLSEYSDHGYG